MGKNTKVEWGRSGSAGLHVVGRAHTPPKASRCHRFPQGESYIHKRSKGAIPDIRQEAFFHDDF